MKFFLDANIPYSAMAVFEELGLEAVHARDAGLGKATDKEIILYAEKNKCILVTKDLEFANPFMFPQESHCGVIVLRLPHFFKANQFAEALEEFLNSVNLSDLEKSITVVKPGRYRIRKTK